MFDTPLEAAVLGTIAYVLIARYVKWRPKWIRPEPPLTAERLVLLFAAFYGMALLARVFRFYFGGYYLCSL